MVLRVVASPEASSLQQQKQRLPPSPPSMSLSSTSSSSSSVLRETPQHQNPPPPPQSQKETDQLLERFQRIVESKQSHHSVDSSPPKKRPLPPPPPPLLTMSSRQDEQSTVPPSETVKTMEHDEEDEDDEDELRLGDAATTTTAAPTARHVPPPRTNDYINSSTKTMSHSPLLYHVPPRQQQQGQVEPKQVEHPQLVSKNTQQHPTPPLRQLPPRNQGPPPQQQRQEIFQPQQQQIPSRQHQHPPRQGTPPQQQRYAPSLQHPQQSQNQYIPQQQQHQIPIRRISSPASSTSIFQSLWSRVEQGLDGLAQVEELVADRASKITHQVTQQAKDLMQTRSTSGAATAPSSTYPHNAANMRSQSQSVQQSQQRERPSESQPATRAFGTVGSFGASKIKVSDASSDSTTTPPIKKMTLASLHTSAHPATSQATIDDDDSDDEQEDDDMPPLQGNKRWDPTIRAGSSSSADYGDPATRTPGIRGPRVSPFTQLQHNDVTTQQTTAPPTVSSFPSFDESEPSSSWKPRLPSLPRMPSILSKLLGRGSGSFRQLNEEAMDIWKEDEKITKNYNHRASWFASSVKKQRQLERPSTSTTTTPLNDLLTRSRNGKSTNLLSSRDLGQCRTVGRNMAALDVICLGLMVVGVHQILPAIKEELSWSIQLLVQASQGWAYHALVAAVLVAATKMVIFDSHTVPMLQHSIASTIHAAAQYSQLYLRLVTGQAVDPQVPELMQQAALAQTTYVIQSNRLRTVTTLVLATMVLLTVSVVKRILWIIVAASGYILSLLPELWPLSTSSLNHVGSSIREISASLGREIRDLVVGEISTATADPTAMLFQASVAAALILVTILPKFEISRKVRPLEQEDEGSGSAFGTVSTISNLGVSSASRLGLLSKSGAIEGTLERWRLALPPSTQSASADGRSVSSSLRRLGYSVVATLFLASPALVYFSCFSGVCVSRGASSSIFRFDSIWDVSILLLFVLGLTWQTIAATIVASNHRPHVQSFVNGLGEVLQEVSGKQQGPSTQLGSSFSPTIGLSIRDLWAAHTSKRAWAVRGVSLDCHNGEVVAILGDDGAGKSRLLTAIAEALVHPTKRSLTTTKVRGSVSVGGLDSMKWDRVQLKKRLGVFLNDVRTIADSAEFMSGLTVEEIMEPMDGLLSRGSSTPTASARAVNQAMQLTGLSMSLLPRLPGKMSTVVTANENELIPSELRPRCHALSPSEWSKILLARVLAQAIFDNESISNAPLVGSVLLLDDLTMCLSEVEELKIIQELRKTGAATVFSSHKWASGRLADRIVVVKDGSVVESGTHGELLARGPQQSIYAAKWNAMTTG